MRGFSRAFSLVELIVAMAISLVVIATVFALLDPARGSFQAESEAADVQQRLRVGVDTLAWSLRVAGAGPSSTGVRGPLGRAFAPIVPARVGGSDADPPGTFRTDTIAVTTVPPGAAEARLRDALAGVSSTLVIDDRGCARAACGFTAGMPVVVYDPASGRRDLATVADVTPGASMVQIDGAAGVGPYPAGAILVQATTTTFHLDADAARGLYRLVASRGLGGPDVPVVDHVVGLAFQYSGDPAPPVLVRSWSDPLGPLTTYGPVPPPPGAAAGTSYPPGENCAFVVDPASRLQTPRLATLAASGALVPLTAADLTDGPWCPDAAVRNRWDADLLRIRRVAVTLRVEAALDFLRGPAGRLFVRGGTSRGRFVPDEEVRFDVVPRNMSFER